MDIREGLIPTALGTAVTAAGYALKQTRGTNKMIANTVFGFGFGLAHVVLGVIDLVEHRRWKERQALIYACLFGSAFIIHFSKYICMT
ncbi:TPA: hypothetical protein QC285_003289 [Bacillus cereus]|uniref:hypothetical protein n=1 Tax=Bacillus cereus group TaxID=86661 RepID=UPI001C54DC5F|nr:MULTISPECIES: hypothetical protein [Bacillus cereus group]HDR8433507.1 hypothetical protein [Bacillus cereus]